MYDLTKQRRMVMEQTVKKQNYFKWLLGQLKGWPQQNYYLFFF